jgi:iron complex outermembrane receptor protein
MSKTQYLCAASAAVLMAVALGSGPAQAQTKATTAAAAAKPPTDVSEVVVTGSFIAGTPENAAIPVEAVTLQDLRDRGTPSNLDLVKSLSEIGNVAGEANRINAFALGAQSVNLRGVSSSRTVVVFNGRRLPEQYSASVGRFNNIALIPNAAIGRVEVLKDGGATTYGADAVGGVVNYITRRNLDGVEANANYRYIKDSDGDYDADVSAGKIGDNWNVMAVVGYIHRSPLKLSDRDWALKDYLYNPSSWNSAGSPGAYTFQRTSTGTAAITPIATAASGNLYSGNVQMGPTGIVRDPACTQLGGFAGWSATPSAVCYFQFGHVQNLVDETNTWQGYGEGNYKFNDYLKFHGEVLVYKLDIPGVQIDNGGALPGNFPIVPGSPTGAQQVIGGSAAFAVPGSNPAVRPLLDSIMNSNGTPAFGAATTPGTLAFQILNGGRVGLNLNAWRPFAYGGNPYPEGDLQHNYSTTLRYTGEFSGDIPDFWGFHLNWKAALTYNDLKYTIEYKDMLIDRLQAALNGFGGAACTGTTAGANGCQYFNPFSSAIAKNVFTGQTNPGFISGLANDPNLVRWLYVPLKLQRDGQYAIVDTVVTGTTPFKLWADDPISIAVGGQYRRFHEKLDLDNLTDRAVSPCATVGVQVCASRTGPLVFNRGLNVTGLSLDSNRTYPVAAAFFEVQAPIVNSLTLQLSGRYEKFYSDVSDVDNSVFVPAASMKWQVTNWLALRGTAGNSFSQVNPPPAIGPTITGNTSAPTALGGTAVLFTSANYPNTEVKPERGFNYNVGAILQVGNFRANVDYYNIQIDDYIRAQATGNIVTALVQPGQIGAGALINCSSALLTQTNAVLGGRPFVQLNGACVPGVSALNSASGGLTGGTVNFLGGQGTQPALYNAGTLTTSGIDASATWHFDDVLGGALDLNADGTQVLTYHLTDYVLAGIKVADGFDGIGFFNLTTGRNGQAIAEFRGSVGFNYRRGPHNFNWTTRMVSSLTNDDTATFFTASNATNANIGANGVVGTGAACPAAAPTVPPVPPGAGTGTNGGGVSPQGAIGFCAGQNQQILTGQKVPATYNTDISYNLTLPWDTTLTVTVQNLFDTDPEFARALINYDAFTGSPLGRTFRIGVRKRW